MENASRAIVMVGGVFLAMLLLALLSYAWTQFGEYQDAQDSITDVEDIAEFNEQFSNYDRDDVQGYELISLANKVADYNNRYASAAAAAEGATGTGSYSPITLTIIIDSSGIENLQSLAFDGENNYLFKYTSYKQAMDTTLIKNVFTRDTDDGNEGVYNIAVAIEDVFGSSSNATRVAKAIDQIFYYYVNGNRTTYADNLWNSGKNREQILELGMQKYNSCVSTANKINDADLLLISTTDKTCLYYYALQYYEYMMFKTMVFECESESGGVGITYDESTQRVSTMTFVCTGRFAS